MRHVVPDSPDEEASGPAPRSPAPPLFTALHKGKGREVQPRSTSRYRKRPGPSAQAHAAGRELQTTPPVPDQPRVTRQTAGGSSTSRRVRGTTEKFWISVAKVYGMMFCPWASEPALRQALHCKPGEGGLGDDEVHELVEFLDEAGISEDDRRHPQFSANVSPAAQLSNLNTMLTLVLKVPAWSSRAPWRDHLSSQRDCDGTPWLWRYS